MPLLPLPFSLAESSPPESLEHAAAMSDDAGGELVGLAAAAAGVTAAVGCGEEGAGFWDVFAEAVEALVVAAGLFDVVDPPGLLVTARFGCNINNTLVSRGRG